MATWGRILDVTAKGERAGGADDINYASIKLFMPMSPRHWTRGEKIPWAAGPEERIQPTPHAVDEFVRYIGGAHVIDVIRWRPRNFTNSFH
jgi:hypothetical protein